MFNGKRVVIWGCGQNLIKKKDFAANFIHPYRVVDSDRIHWGKEIIPGCVCVSPDDLDEINPDVVVISPEKPLLVSEIKEKAVGKCTEIYTLNELWEKNEIKLQKEVDFGVEDKRIKHFACSLGDSICNLGCSYCYLNYQSVGGTDMDFGHSVDFMVKAVSRSRMGGRCFFNMCSNGETLLKPHIVDFTRGLLEEGHYVCLITNGAVTSKIDELLSFPMELKKRLLFHCSLHYIELKKRGLVDTYFDNVNKIHDAGASVSMSVIGSDEYIPYRDEIRKVAKERTGTFPYISPCRTEGDYKATEEFQVASKFSWDEYMEIWRGFPGHSLDMRDMTMGRITIPCYAGISSGIINFDNGIIQSCVPGEVIDNIYEDIKRRINFYKLPHGCKWGFCSHNGMFLSGREISGRTLPTWNDMCTVSDDFISDEIREATDYCSDY